MRRSGSWRGAGDDAGILPLFKERRGSDADQSRRMTELDELARGWKDGPGIS
jgi:hypothetical protein